MKVYVESNSLKDAFGKLLSVVDKKNTRPILSNCLVKVFDNSLEIFATDLEVTARIKVFAEVEGQGFFCVNSKNMFDILRELPDTKMEMEIDNEKNVLNLHCNQIDYSLLLNNHEDYPQISFENYGKPFNLKSKQVLDIINKTAHAVSTDETRINLNGIYMQLIDNKLRAVAIDGHRLALLDIDGVEIQNDNLVDGVIIPRKGIQEIKKLADTYLDEDLEICIDESFIYVKAKDEYFLSVRLISREYPKYQTVIPSKTTYTMKADKNALLNAVKRIRLLSNEKTNGIKATLNESTLEISANHPSLGHAIEKIDVQYDGNKQEIGFNAKYIIEALSIFDETEVIFELNNELSPIILRSDDYPSFLGIIMPLKL
jgi:DNA polymerase-3 subunit beta